MILQDYSFIDSTAETRLQQESLLNGENLLEMHKVYDCSKKTLTFIQIIPHIID